MPRKTTTKFMVKLDCDHPLVLSSTIPSIQSLQFCPSCDDYRRVAGYPEFYRAVCLGDPKCGDYISISSDKARSWMERHCKTRTHTTELTKWHDNNAEKVARYSRQDGWSDAPGLQHFSDVASSLLRNVTAGVAERNQGTGRARTTDHIPTSSLLPQDDIVIRTIGKRDSRG